MCRKKQSVMVAIETRRSWDLEMEEEETVLSLVKAVLDIKGVSTLNVNLKAFVHLLKKVLKPETWQNLLQVNTRTHSVRKMCKS